MCVSSQHYLCHSFESPTSRLKGSLSALRTIRKTSSDTHLTQRPDPSNELPSFYSQCLGELCTPIVRAMWTFADTAPSMSPNLCGKANSSQAAYLPQIFSNRAQQTLGCLQRNLDALLRLEQRQPLRTLPSHRFRNRPQDISDSAC